MDRLEFLIKRVIGEEFWPDPAVRAARRLHDMGLSPDDVRKIHMESAIKVQVVNAMRKLAHHGENPK